MGVGLNDEDNVKKAHHIQVDEVYQGEGVV